MQLFLPADQKAATIMVVVTILRICVAKGLWIDKLQLRGLVPEDEEESAAGIVLVRIVQRTMSIDRSVCCIVFYSILLYCIVFYS